MSPTPAESSGDSPEATSPELEPEHRGGSERSRTVLAGLAAVGLAALAVTRDWTSETVENAAGLTSTATEAGTELATWALPCALVGGAAFLAMLATGRRARRVLGAFALLAGLAVALAGILHAAKGIAPIGLAAAGLGLAAAGAAAMLRAGRWPEPSARYETSTTEAIAEDPAQLWNALDAGKDPSSPNITGAAQEKGRST
ncbi:Trp biosynthesis-associated membrane protein [Glycomyces buryatensis]|uniref:Trp biosynthesis protein n=1 Tax=Glycomyces buryatensis TaxID=2570927 RepID=A0A4V4HQP7_9ACTN|nr:Trp biosynthesis-associated membrane protein [Glycomyces buryatensis]THV34636.1 Trp biosynthesis protein [Glycomyces buryatensis]